MIIPTDQLAAMSAAIRDRIVRDALLQLPAAHPAWSAGRPAPVLEAELRDWAAEFARCRIYDAKALARLLDGMAASGMCLPLPALLQQSLSEKGRSDGERADHFLLSLESGNYRLTAISLEDETNQPTA